MNSEDQDLLARYLDDALTDEQAAQLQTLLRESPEARRMLRDLATVDAKLTELAASTLDSAGMLETLSLESARPRRELPPGSGYAWRVACGIAVGLVVGVVSSSVAWAYGVPRWFDADRVPLILVEEGFESTVPEPAGLPTRPEVWSGDFARVVGSLAQIQPAQGGKMLEVLRTDYEGKPNSEGSYCGDLFRLVDVRPYRELLADGTAVANLSAVFNALPFAEGEEYSISISLNALSADMASTPLELMNAVRERSLAMARTGCPRIDRDPATWQRLETEMRVPAEAEVLLVHVSIIHALPAQRRVELGGQFLDNVRVVLSRKPARP